jgi:hypothetical protein
MQNIFDPVIEEIKSLVSEQVKEARKKKGALINVGSPSMLE